MLPVWQPGCCCCCFLLLVAAAAVGVARGLLMLLATQSSLGFDLHKFSYNCGQMFNCTAFSLINLSLGTVLLVVRRGQAAGNIL